MPLSTTFNLSKWKYKIKIATIQCSSWRFRFKWVNIMLMSTHKRLCKQVPPSVALESKLFKKQIVPTGGNFKVIVTIRGQDRTVPGPVSHRSRARIALFVRSWPGIAPFPAWNVRSWRNGERVAFLGVRNALQCDPFLKKISGTRCLRSSKTGTRSRNAERRSVPAHPWVGAIKECHETK